MAQDLCAEDGVDAVAGVQHEILPQPGHCAGEQHEHDEGDGDDDEGGLGLVHHHLVDDDLREHRRAQTDDLDEERGEQHVAPDALVLEEFWNEPAEAECGWGGFCYPCPLSLDPSPRGREGSIFGDEDEVGLEIEVELPQR